MLRRHLAKSPTDASAMSLIAEVLTTLRKFDQALFFSRRAVELRPNNASDRSNLGTMLHKMGKFDEALVEFQAGQRLDPRVASNFTGEGVIAAERKEFENAEALFRKAMELDPRLAFPAFNLATIQIGRGRAELAAETARHAINRGCDPTLLVRILTQFANYATDDPQQLGELFRVAGVVAQRGQRPPAPFANSRDPERTLRVGMLSTDLRFHAVMHFIEHLIERLPTLNIRLYAYQLDPRTDDVTERVRPHFVAWRNCVSQMGEVLERTIRDDGIDVLIDLVGWLERNRIETLARKAAPVQVTYCGFPNTTGLTTVDARIVDSITDPPDSAMFNSEKLVRLDPCFLCYRPSVHASHPRQRPAGAPLTFGSFNAIWKMTEAAARVWGSVLQAMPESQMVIKTSSGEPWALREWLPQAMGVAPDRVRFLPFSDTPAEHLATYHEVDIALDTFPYHGTTTTCEALLMGVPVVSLQGRVHAARVGGSLLRAVGLPELVAQKPEDVVRIAVGLAGDEPRLRRWRGELPEMLRSSVLCDEAGHAARFAGEIRDLWRGWCQRP